MGVPQSLGSFEGLWDWRAIFLLVQSDRILHRLQTRHWRRSNAAVIDIAVTPDRLSSTAFSTCGGHHDPLACDGVSF